MLFLHTTRLILTRGRIIAERSRVFVRLCETSKRALMPRKSLRVLSKPVTALHLHARHDTGRSPDFQISLFSTAVQDLRRTALPSGSALSASGHPTFYGATAATIRACPVCRATSRITWDMQGFVVEIRMQWRVPGTKTLCSHTCHFFR